MKDVQGFVGFSFLKRRVPIGKAGKAPPVSSCSPREGHKFDALPSNGTDSKGEDWMVALGLLLDCLLGYTLGSCNGF